MLLGRLNVTIVSPNAPRTLKRYYSNRKCSSANAMLNPNWAKSGSGAPAVKSAPSDTKSATFAKGIFQACRGMKSTTFADCFVQHLNVLKFSPQAWVMGLQRCRLLRSNYFMISNCCQPAMSAKQQCLWSAIFANQLEEYNHGRKN